MAEPGDRTLEWIKAIGMPLVTLVVTVLGGFYFTSLTKDRETRHSNETLYAQLVTQRENSDAQIRKDMFNVVISQFLADPKGALPDTRVLQLELLANNFSQSLDLAPLFKDLARRLTQAPAAGASAAAATQALKKRLDAAAANLVFKQVNSLANRGFVADEQVNLSGWEKSFGTPVIDRRIVRADLAPAAAGGAAAGAGEEIRFTVEIVDVDLGRREVEVRLIGYFPGEQKAIDRHFWVGLYDFPMLDNMQLPYGLRVSVVSTEFFVPEQEDEREANSFVVLHLVVFPASSASLKERQDYDDILRDMLRTRPEAWRSATR